jgi:ferredoxin-NADP reductase
MPRFASKLIDRREVAAGTMLFAFERPRGFDFTPGQFMTVSLADPPHTDAKGNRRMFSIASPPQETGRLEVATRMTGSALKRSLAEMPAGTPVELLGPGGSFTLIPDASAPAVLIAGGIGITPFRSIAHDAVARRLPQRIVLIHSNRDPEGTAFRDEFERLAASHPSFTYVPTMTDAAPSSWGGERRRVDAGFLRDHVGDVGAPTFYIAGPPGMVTGVTGAVLDAGANPARVRSEEFEGY